MVALDEAYERRDQLEQRRGQIADQIADLEHRLAAARRDAGEEEAKLLKAEHADGFRNWAGKGFMGGIFAWVPLIAIAIVVGLADCATDDGQRIWTGSVIASTRPEMPVASACAARIQERADDRCRVSITCGPGEGSTEVYPSVRCTTKSVTNDDDDTVSWLEVENEDRLLSLHENTGLGRLASPSGGSIEILLHDFDAEPPR